MLCVPRRGHQSAANQPELDFQITFVDGAEGEALVQQQANVFCEIARWHAAHQDGGTTHA